MNELINMSDDELNTLKNEISVRRERFMTKEGCDDAKKVMLGMFDYLQASGYKLPDTDYNQMAGIYADQLKEHIIIFGYDAIKKAVREYVRSDDDKYHQMPTAGQIIAVVERENGDPRHEIAVREYEREVEQMVAKERKELMDGVTPERLKELEAKYERNR